MGMYRVMSSTSSIDKEQELLRFIQSSRQTRIAIWATER
jgi:hypothetical protein